jgi:hypothetical protein
MCFFNTMMGFMRLKNIFKGICIRFSTLITLFKSPKPSPTACRLSFSGGAKRGFELRAYIFPLFISLTE